VRSEVPQRLAVLAETGDSIWLYEAFGTRYRGLVVRIQSFEAASLFGWGADWLVAIEPAGGKLEPPLKPGRMWATFADGRETLHQSYVEEKFQVQGEDAEAITMLVAAMLGRFPALTSECDIQSHTPIRSRS
jgi:hypothetical protein